VRSSWRGPGRPSRARAARSQTSQVPAWGTSDPKKGPSSQVPGPRSQSPRVLESQVPGPRSQVPESPSPPESGVQTEAEEVSREGRGRAVGGWGAVRNVLGVVNFSPCSRCGRNFRLGRAQPPACLPGARADLGCKVLGQKFCSGPEQNWLQRVQRPGRRGGPAGASLASWRGGPPPLPLTGGSEALRMEKCRGAARLVLHDLHDLGDHEDEGAGRLRLGPSRFLKCS
jgi:hypothetical protein